MKIAVKLLLFVFLTFLATPTIVSLIQKSCDTSCFYSMSEEEHSHKEIKAEFKFDTDFEFVNLSGFTPTRIASENDSKHDNVAATIFIPPPEQV